MARTNTNIGGGGGGGVNSVAGSDSIVSSPNPITNTGTLSLVGDVASPNDLQFYGTDTMGNRGWYDQSSIDPALTATYIGYGGTMTNTLTGSSKFTFNPDTVDFEISGGTNGYDLSFSDSSGVFSMTVNGEQWVGFSAGLLALGAEDGQGNGYLFVVNDTDSFYDFRKPNFQINGVPYQFPAIQGGASTVLTNDGSGNLSWTSDLTPVLPSGDIFVGNVSNVATAVTMSGDATISNTGALTVGNNKITYAKFQQVAASSLVGNPTGGLANAQGITLGAGLNFSGTTLVATGSGGTVTAVSVATANGFQGTSSGGTTPILTISTSIPGSVELVTSAAGQLVVASLPQGAIYVGQVSNAPGAVNPGGDISSISVTGSFTIANNAVTYAKMQKATTHTLIGNSTGGTANIQEITLGSGLNFSGTTLVATGSGGTVTSIATNNGITGGTITGTGTIGLANIAANSVLANLTGGSAAPSSALGYSTTATASNLVERDAQANIFANNAALNTTSTVSSGGTIAMSTASSHNQIVTGTLAETFTLPNATVLTVGWVYQFINDTAQTITVNNNGGGLVASIPIGGRVELICTNTGSANGTWEPLNTTGIPLPLTSAHLYVGSSGGTAADVPASGDLTLANTGAFTVNTVNGGNFPVQTIGNQNLSQSGSNATFLVVSAPATATYTIYGYVNVTTAGTGIAALSVTVNWTDENSQAQTFTFMPNLPLTSLHQYFSGGFPAVRTKSGTNITISSVFTAGTGSPVWDLGANIVRTTLN